MKNKYLLTIITCCYNSEKSIENCVKSVLKQITDDVEYLIIDGASTDNTLNILEKYSDKIRIVSEKDSGIYNAMNKGIDKAQGKYIIFMNSDDKLRDGALEVILNSVKTNRDCYYGDTETHYVAHGEDYSRIEIAEEDFHLLNKGVYYYHQSFWCTKKCLLKIGKFQEQYKLAADWDLMYRLNSAGCSFEHVNFVIADYYHGGSSYKWHVWENHLVRKNNKAYKFIDWYIIRDFIKFSKNAILDKIIGIDNHYLLIAKRKGFKKK